jgi:TnpA family transposase
MIHLELTNEEEQYLKEEVQKRLTDLDHEIAYTDSMGFKDMLKRRREVVRKFLEKLPDAAAIAA